MTQQTNKSALYILMFNMFITMGGIGIIVPVLPLFLESFNAGGTVIGALTAGFAFAQFLMSPIVGDLSDRYGRKPFIIGGLILYSFSMLLFGLSSELWLLFLARFLSGAGAAFIMPPIMAYVADITTIEERGKGMGMIGASISLGFTVGPGIGGILSGINLQFPFFFAATAALIAAIVSAIVLPNVQRTISAKVNDAPRKRSNLVKQLAASTAKPYFMFLLVVFTFSFGVANLQSTLAIYLTNKFSYSPLDISIILTVGGILGVILQGFVVGKLFKKFGELKVILVNLVAAAVTTLLIIFLSKYFIILFVTVLFSVATTFIRPAVNTLISKVAGQEQGYAAGMNTSYMSLGNMFGPLLAGILYDWKHDSPYILGFVVLMLCFLLTYIWARSKVPHLLKNA